MCSSELPSNGCFISGLQTCGPNVIYSFHFCSVVQSCSISCPSYPSLFVSILFRFVYCLSLLLLECWAFPLQKSFSLMLAKVISADLWISWLLLIWPGIDPSGHFLIPCLWSKCLPGKSALTF